MADSKTMTAGACVAALLKVQQLVIADAARQQEGIADAQKRAKERGLPVDHTEHWGWAHEGDSYLNSLTLAIKHFSALPADTVLRLAEEAPPRPAPAPSPNPAQALAAKAAKLKKL